MVPVLLHGDVVHEGEVLIPVHLVQQHQIVLQLVQHNLEKIEYFEYEEYVKFLTVHIYDKEMHPPALLWYDRNKKEKNSSKLRKYYPGCWYFHIQIHMLNWHMIKNKNTFLNNIKNISQ